jgi:hypothetical protein
MYLAKLNRYRGQFPPRKVVLRRLCARTTMAWYWKPVCWFGSGLELSKDTIYFGKKKGSRMIHMRMFIINQHVLNGKYRRVL